MVTDLSRCTVVARPVTTATYPRGTGYGPRIIKDFEFVWMVSGTATWLIGDQEVVAPPGTVLLARPGMRDAFRWDPDRPTVHGFVHFTLSGPVPDPTGWPLVRTLPDQDILRPLFAHAGWLQTQEGGAAQAGRTVRLALEAFLSGRLGLAAEDRGDLPPAVQRMLDRIGVAIDTRERITLADLVRVSGASRSSLAVQSKAALGCTPMAASRLLRLERAAQLLTRTDLAIQEIAALVGFEDAFHFSRLFHDEFTHAPRDFRRLALLGEVSPERQRMARRLRRQ